MCAMKNPESRFTMSLLRYREAIITKLENMEKTLLEIQRDIHIQTLAADAKLGRSHRQAKGVLNGFAAKIDKMVKDIEEIKQSTK